MGLFTDGFKLLKKASEPLYKTPKSIQETIEIMAVAENGIFEVSRNKYSKCYRFQDINYTKDAWMEAAKEVNANGLGIKGNGMLSHISQMMVQRLNKQMKGEDDVDNIDILGNTTESAIQATKQALYDLDHPKEYVPKSIEVQRACMKEREFYVAFLEKLEKL